MTSWAGSLAQLVQPVGDVFGAIGRQAETEHGDGDGVTSRGIFAMKNATQAASPDLVQHSIAAEGRRWIFSR